MCPLVKELGSRANIQQVVCVTAQHRDMLDQILADFGVVPQHDLNIMRHGQTLSQIMSRALEGLEAVIKAEAPDLVLAHGDTATTFAASLAAYYHRIKLGHVEAGLRTYDKYQPYPEEMNRRLTGVLADLHFAPTSLSKENLLKENISADSIYVTGNTQIDALKYSLKPNYTFRTEALNGVDYENRRVVTVTAHRSENIGAPMERICRALRKLADQHDIYLVWPVHANPAVGNTVREYLAGHERVLLTPPVDMNDMHNLLSRSYMVLTDSGGLQEEAPALRKPTLVLRNVTERPEGVTAGTLRLTGSEDEDEIYEMASQLLTDPAEYAKMADSPNPYGDGNASRRIADIIEYSFGFTAERPEDYKA
jgi:UDP-N-acetylglucosamine 2-epimerase (non-hydrolysing)